jgi:SpoVK/Ycf46/Vps4 family AAA+-type ATPase
MPIKGVTVAAEPAELDGVMPPPQQPLEPFLSSLEHILAELERIDLLVNVRVRQVQLEHHNDDGMPGLYISEQEVESLLARPNGMPPWAASCGQDEELQSVLGQMAEEIERRMQASPADVDLRLVSLANRFGLSPIEIDIILVCLAPELDLRYERLYAYLQDDVTKKRPGVDLVLSLLSSSVTDKVAGRRRFAGTAPLIQLQLLRLIDDPSQQQTPLLGKYLKLDERVVGFLLGADDVDAALLPHVRTVEPESLPPAQSRLAELRERLVTLANRSGDDRSGLIIYLQGSYGAGKQTVAESICHELGVDLLVVDTEGLLGTEQAEATLGLVAREAILQGAALYWDRFDSLLAEDRQAWLRAFTTEMQQRQGLSFLAGETTWEPADAWHDHTFVRTELSRLDHGERVRLWSDALDKEAASLTKADLEELAGLFRFSAGQIRDAVATARNLARMRSPESALLSIEDLKKAGRLQSNRKLGALAHKLVPHYTWDDIILPADQMQQLGEICSRARARSRIYDEWGFGRKLSLGKGLNVLFTGPSGTGKTMAAEVIANQLGLDLYRIDLSGVVSKYIGETEKNLARIFDEAETTNAILFFDEADALFGKRSEVKDSHDRYANIEISYLLQRMEEYEGLSILATNLRRNLDSAFVRRMAFIVHFAVPEEADRLRIWQGVWPPETPRADDLDLEFLARQLKLAGGSIKNIAVAAAFLAAEDDSQVMMKHLVRATRRELEKLGKLVVESDLGDYAGLLEEA